MKPKRRRCSCGELILWALSDTGRWVDVNPQATLDRYGVQDPVVLWGETAPGHGPGEQRVSSLADFIRQTGAAYPGPVWVLHMHTCRELDRPIGWTVSARGRRLLAILESTKRRKGGAV